MVLYELGEYVGRNLQHWIHMFEFGRVPEQYFSIENQHIPMIPTQKSYIRNVANHPIVNLPCGDAYITFVVMIWRMVNMMGKMALGFHPTFKCSMGHQHFFLSPIACRLVVFVGAKNMTCLQHRQPVLAKPHSVRHLGPWKNGGETKHDMMMIMLLFMFVTLQICHYVILCYYLCLLLIRYFPFILCYYMVSPSNLYYNEKPRLQC